MTTLDVGWLLWEILVTTYPPGESCGELNYEVFCGELGPSKEELGALAEARVI